MANKFVEITVQLQYFGQVVRKFLLCGMEISKDLEYTGLYKWLYRSVLCCRSVQVGQWQRFLLEFWPTRVANSVTWLVNMIFDRWTDRFALSGALKGCDWLTHSKKFCHFIGQVFLTDLANSQLGVFGGQGMFYCVTKGILEISLAPLSIFKAFFKNVCLAVTILVQATAT